MGSSRLPGKMLEPIMGQPLMYHIIARALQIRCAQAVYLATTDQPIDDPLVDLAQKMGLKVVRGSEDNVMQRFFLAIDDADADYIIRICGDAPLFDPEIHGSKHGCDYGTRCGLYPSNMQWPICLPGCRPHLKPGTEMVTYGSTG